MASLKDRQQKTVTASGKPAFHPPGCSPPGRCAHGSATRPCPCCRLLPCRHPSGKASPRMPVLSKMSGIRGLAACRASLFCGACRISKKDFAPLPPGSRPKATGSNPAPQPERKSPYDGCRKGFFCTLLFSVLRQSPVLCHSLQDPAPSTTAASARSASGYRSLRPFYSQGRPRWADPSRNRNVPLIP